LVPVPELGEPDPEVVGFTTPVVAPDAGGALFVEAEPEPEAPGVAVTPNAASATPFEIVGVVTQLLDEGVKYAEEGVTVSPTV